MASVKCSFLQSGFFLKKLLKYCTSRWFIAGLLLVHLFLAGLGFLLVCGVWVFPPLPQTPVKFLLVLNLFLRMTETPQLTELGNNHLLPVRRRCPAVTGERLERHWLV